MNKNHQEVIEIFQPEILGDFAKIWLDDWTIGSDDFTLEDAMKIGWNFGCGIVGMRKGVNGWDDICFLGPVDGILEFGWRYLDGTLHLLED